MWVHCLTACLLASAQVMQLQQGFADAESRVQELEASEARLKARVGDLERAEEVLPFRAGHMWCVLHPLWPPINYGGGG